MFFKVVFISILVSSCATKALIAPGANGVHTSSAYSSERVHAVKVALADAAKYCEEKGSAYAVVGQSVKYKGQLWDEQTNEGVKRVGKVISILGVPGAGGLNADDDYEAIVKFKCQ